MPRQLACRLIATAVLCLAISGPAAAADDDDPSLTGRLAFYGLAAGADLASTHWAESRGAVERNPLLRPIGVRYALSAGSVPALALLDRELERRDKRLAWALRALRIAAVGYAVSKNLRHGR